MRLNNRHKKTNQQKKTFGKPLMICGLLGLLAVSLLISACNKSTEIEAAVEKNVEIPESNEYSQVLWLDGSYHLYQPLFPQKTPLYDIKDMDQYHQQQLFMTELGLAFRYGDAEAEGFSYRIYNDLGQEIIYEEITPQLDDITGDVIFRIDMEDIHQDLYIGNSYFMDFYVQSLNLHYYSPFIYTSVDGNEIAMQETYHLLKELLKEQGISMMHEPFIYLKADSAYSGQIEYQFVGAKREEEGFSNHDYIYTYQLDFETMNSEIESMAVMPKNRNYYSKEENAWVLGESIKPRRVVTSSNQRFEVYYTDYEMMLYDVIEEELHEVYRLDSLDSDYIYDEFMDHKLEVIEVSNTGEIMFTIFGYIHDNYSFSEQRGMALYSYSRENGLSISGFIENGRNLQGIKNYLLDNSYYIESKKLLYIYNNYMLYRLDLNTGSFDYIDTFIGGELFQEQGLIVWQGEKNKYYGSIYVIDLKMDEIKVNNLYKTGVYQHLLGVEENSIIVGRYYLEDTYEKLNGEVIYPYYSIMIFSSSGQIMDYYYAKDALENGFYSDIYYSEAEDRWMTELVTMDFSRSDRYENSRVNFTSTGQQISILEVGQTTEHKLIKEGVITDVTRLHVAIPKEQSIIYTPNPKVSTPVSEKYLFNTTPMVNSFVVSEANGKQSYYGSFKDALKKGENLKEYTIREVVVKYIKDEKTGESIRQYEYIKLFDSSWYKESIYLDQVIEMPQRPELPRGCEVTALSILLNYYMDQAPDKMILSDKLKSSNMEYVIEDGFVNFADMHVEFAGSMDDVSKPGLGVYVGPIKELAEEYIGSRVQNLSGINFEQLLAYVSDGKPALVIIPNRYQEVSDYALEVWKTPSGYMEVTYQEHSVVIMGYDENYIYYSDPSKGIIDKKPRADFKKAWISIGSQALVIF